MKYSFEERAENEFLDQLLLYQRSGGEKASGQFNTAVKSTINRLLNHPESGVRIDADNTRKAVLKKYPYAIIYQFKKSKQLIEIIAVAHTSRKPGYWKVRTK